MKRWSFHGGRYTAEYYIWCNMLARCKKHPNYRGRGLKVCERWQSFSNFILDMGLRPSGKHSIERMDNNKGYEPGNCKWATRKEQSNNRRTNRYITISGFTLTLAQWCEMSEVNYRTVLGRITRLGWDPWKALTTPAQKQERTK